MARSRSHVTLEIVAAVARNGAIGVNNALPWRMPSDLARFKAATLGKPMIMGRRTWTSIGRALPGRESIVVSRTRNLELPSGVHLASDLAAASEIAALRATLMGAPSVALIGGASLFEEMIGVADRLTMTFIDLHPQADTFFPRIDPFVWRETRREEPERDPRDDARCVFVDYRRS